MAMNVKPSSKTGWRRRADEDAFERAVVGQIWAANMVAYRKFTWITWSIRALVVGVVALAAVALT